MEKTDDFERIYYSYEEWRAGSLPWANWGFGFGESGVRHQPENVIKFHILSESEYLKIVGKQEEILADHVKKNLAFYIQQFEERLKAPGEVDRRIEDEIQQVDKILTDKALALVPIWYNEGQAYINGVVGMSPDGGQYISPDFKNEIAYWYYKIIIRADPENQPCKFMLPKDDGIYSRYIPQVMALVLYQYRQYLLNLTGFDIENFTFRDSNPPPGKTHIVLCCPPTDNIFEGLRKYKPSRQEFFMFKDSFHLHPFASNERLRNELPKLMDEIFERAAHLRSDLQAYFLEEMEKDVVGQIENNDSLINERFNFQKMFKERLSAVKTAEQKRLEEVEAGDTLAEIDGKSTPTFTTAQSVLAIFHLLKAANFDRGKTSELVFAQFIQMLTGKEPNTKAKDTTILKRWRAVITEREALNPKDLEVIRDWFEKMGLDEVAATIAKRKKKGRNNKE